ncbi:hypothetical protein KW797_00240 [Candidatus Parcubacteria bacterium]|nr:hypothetical protein [Candidatus Parcubacteria bacterium]
MVFFAMDSTLNLSLERIAQVRDLNAGTIQECILVLFSKQHDQERAYDESFGRNRVGFSRGTVTWGSLLAKKLLAGETWSEWEVNKARTIIAIHRKQLATLGLVTPG